MHQEKQKKQKKYKEPHLVIDDIFKGNDPEVDKCMQQYMSIGAEF